MLVVSGGWMGVLVCKCMHAQGGCAKDRTDDIVNASGMY